MVLTNKRVGLFVIDPQNDFCDPKGALSVPGADQDMARLAAFVDRVGKKLSGVYVTLDTHHNFDIGHPLFFVNGKLEHPNPWTVISQDDVKNGVWRATIPSLQKWLEQYVVALAQAGRYPLMVWPPHCLIGQPGSNVYEPLRAALQDWEQVPGHLVNYCTKGSNFKTEHYSIFQAEVPDPADPTTQFNVQFADEINKNDVVLVAGEARTHCVLNSLRDLVDRLGDDFVKKLVILKDATSNIPSFEQTADAFFDGLKTKGLTELTTADVVL